MADSYRLVHIPEYAKPRGGTISRHVVYEINLGGCGED